MFLPFLVFVRVSVIKCGLDDLIKFMQKTIFYYLKIEFLQHNYYICILCSVSFESYLAIIH